MSSREGEPRSTIGGALLFLSAGLPVLFVVLLAWAAYWTFGPKGVGLGSSASLLTMSSWTLPLLVTSVGTGFAVMGFLQLVKPELRATFHRRAILRWLSLNGGSSVH